MRQGRGRDPAVRDLGAGKTTLTQFIAAGLEVPPDCYVISPSFSLMLEYPGRIPLYHLDCYRLTGEDDVEGSGLMDYIVADGLAVVEWPDRLGTPETAGASGDCARDAGEGARMVLVTPHGRHGWNGWRTCVRSALTRRLRVTGLMKDKESVYAEENDQAGGLPETVHL